VPLGDHLAGGRRAVWAHGARGRLAGRVDQRSWQAQEV
jgi:hypothetical protein